MAASERENNGLGPIAARTAVFSLVILVIYGVISYFFRDHLLSTGTWLGENFGLYGAALYCFLIDMLIVPATVDVLFVFTTNWDPVSLLAVMSIASMVGGFCGYLIARTLNHLRIIHQLTESYHERGKAMIDRYGGWAVAIAGLTPIPFSTICWIAGLLQVPWYEVLAGTLARIPRMVVYYLLIRGGFSLFGMIPQFT